MPRSNRPRRGGRPRRREEPQDEVVLPGGERREQQPDGEWAVRPVTGQAAVKPYRCPGCDQLIPPGTPHQVAWPVDGTGGVAERRHWHTPCWAARARRRPR